MQPAPGFARCRIGAPAFALALLSCGGASTPPPPAPDPVQIAVDPVDDPEPEPPPPAVLPAVVPAPLPEFDVAALRRSPPPKQAHTPAVVRSQLASGSLTVRWSATVGKTTFRTTMAHVGSTIVIGTHGATLDGKNEGDDAVHVLDARTGARVRLIRAPGSGDLDVGGVAVHDDTVFFTTDNGLVVASALAGTMRWNAPMHGKVRPAPALGDLDGDGVIDVVAGDENGHLAVFDGDTGHEKWRASTGVNAYGNKGFVGAAAIGDLDGDGDLDVVAGGRDATLVAYDGRSGRVLWRAKNTSGLHASPSLADFDGDGQREVLAAWSYGDVAVLDAATGRELWGARLERDDGGIEGLFGTPTPVPGNPGVILAMTSWWGGSVDGVIGVGPSQRMFKSFEGRVTASPVVTNLDDSGPLEAIVGTEGGELLAFGPDGSRVELARLGGGIEASALLTDTDGDGTFELLVASLDGKLTCFETGSRSQPFLARFRGNSPDNRGDLGAVGLGWRAGSAPPSAPVTQGIRSEYLPCCAALALTAASAAAPRDRELLRAAAQCNAMAAAGLDRGPALGRLQTLLGGDVPAACR